MVKPGYIFWAWGQRNRRRMSARTSCEHKFVMNHLIQFYNALVQKISSAVWKGIADVCSGRTYPSNAWQHVEQATSFVWKIQGASSLMQSIRRVGSEPERWTCWCKLKARDQDPVDLADKTTIFNQHRGHSDLHLSFWFVFLLRSRTWHIYFHEARAADTKQTQQQICSTRQHDILLR